MTLEALRLINAAVLLRVTLALLLSQAGLQLFNSETAIVTVSFFYSNGLTVSKSEQVVLKGAVPTPGRSSAGMLAQMPTSPRYPCEEFDVSIIVNTGGQALATWVIQLTYDTAVLELRTNTEKKIRDAVRITLASHQKLELHYFVAISSLCSLITLVVLIYLRPESPASVGSSCLRVYRQLCKSRYNSNSRIQPGNVAANCRGRWYHSANW